MGEEIAKTKFRHYDFARFERALAGETDLLGEWFRDGRFAETGAVGGLELEVWLVDAAGRPVPLNDAVIDRVNRADVVHELSRFNVEFNVDPQPLAGRGLAALTDNLAATWDHCDRAARELDASVVAIGTLPTLTADELCLRNLSTLKRYQALNEQVLRLRQGKPIRLDIRGRDRLRSEHRDVTLEAATTSFQVHLQVSAAESGRALNASSIVSAATVAVSANAPMLFGKDVWDETRIPLFEQAIDIGRDRFARVTFGSGYSADTPEAWFRENRDQYPILLPLTLDGLVRPAGPLTAAQRHDLPVEPPADRVRRRRHPAPASRTPGHGRRADARRHGREHGVLSRARGRPRGRRGPARNPACRSRTPGRTFMPPRRSAWTPRSAGWTGKQWPIRGLIADHLVPLAASGLAARGVDEADARRWLEIIARRAETGQTGAAWQRRFVARHGPDWGLLTREYQARQRTGDPVHTWTMA